MITQAATRNTELLGELGATAHAPGQLANNHKKLEGLGVRVGAQEKETQAAVRAVETQLDLHKSFRDSFTKRFIYTVFGKRGVFDNKAMREERSYHEALDTRRKAEGQLAELEASRDALISEAKTLEALLARHGAAHEAIDQLYASLFDGPTPGFPHEDEQEARYTYAKSNHEHRSGDLKSITGCVKAAQTLKVAIERAMLEQNRANLQTRSSLYSGSYMLSIFLRINRYVEQGLKLSALAIDSIPGHLRGPQIAQARERVDWPLRGVQQIVSDKNRYWTRTDSTAAAERIGELLASAVAEQKAFLATVKTVSEAGRNAIRATARALEDERQGLQQIRQGTFETTLGFGAAAPAYHECCDRAEGFEGDVDQACARVVRPEVEILPDLPPPEYAEVPASGPVPTVNLPGQVSS